MRVETVYNPDVRFAVATWDVSSSPQLSHFETVHHNTLPHSENPIINSLITAGHDIHPTVTTFFMGFEGITFKLERHYPAFSREEYQLDFGDGHLTFRFTDAETVFLTLFTIRRERRGKGLAKIHFPKTIDALFRAGVRRVHGEVASAYCEPRNSLDVNKLIRFYVRENGFAHDGGREISKESPYKAKEPGRQVIPLRRAKRLSPSRLLPA